MSRLGQPMSIHQSPWMCCMDAMCRTTDTMLWGKGVVAYDPLKLNGFGGCGCPILCTSTPTPTEAFTHNEFQNRPTPCYFLNGTSMASGGTLDAFFGKACI